MTSKEIKELFPIEIEVTNLHRELADLMGGPHKLGITLLVQSLPKELHENIFWGLSIGTVQGVEIKTTYKEKINGKIVELPLYLDSNFKGKTIIFRLRNN